MIANVLAKLKYIEELGEGWDKIIDEYKSYPLNPKMPAIEATAKKYASNFVFYKRTS